MASDLETSIRNAAEKITQYVEDISSLTVETKYVAIGAGGDIDFEAAKPVAKTVIKIDSDSESTVPMRVDDQGRFEVDADLLELHQRNVSTAIEYRAKLLNALLGVLKS